MKNLDKLNKVTWLAKKFGTPLISAEFFGASDFIGESVVFSYKVGETVLVKKYENPDRGIEEEIARLEKQLVVLNSLH